MRTFHNLKLIKRVIENPFDTIGQRSYYLFRNYITPYIFYTKAKYNEKLEEELLNLPSIEDFVAKEFGEIHERSVMFDYYLGWIAEDERELFSLCMDRIFKYESTFPLSESEYNFELSITYKLDLKDLLKQILMRPGMYGIHSLSGIRAFLDGYFIFKEDYSISLSEYEQRLFKMINKWKAETNSKIPFNTWDREFAKQKLGTTDFTNSFTWEIGRFEEILKDYTKMDLTNPEVKNN